MLMDTYKSVEHDVQAIQYDGRNAADITSAAGAGNVSLSDGGDVIQVRPGSGPWTTLHPGWWVVLHDGVVGVVSEGSFAAIYRPAAGVV